MSSSNSSFNSASKQSDNRAGYNQWSGNYDRYPNPTVAIDEIVFPTYWSHLSGLTVLEIGCGTGRHTQKLLKQNNTVTGLDLSEGMLAKAREKLPSENLTLIHADLLAYDQLAPRSFDAILAALVIEHIQDLDALFAKLASLLKQDGSIFISEIHPIRTAQGILAHFKTGDGHEVHLLSHAHSEREIETAATNAGLKIEKSDTIVGTKELAAVNPKWEKHLGQPMIQIWTFRRA